MIVGVLGGGQLGRMLALAGYPLGLRFRFLDPSPDAPAGRVGERMAGAYDDPAVLERFSLGLQVVTYEFENVPVSAARFLAERLPVYPPPEALETAQDRLNEKRLFQQVEIPVPAFAPVSSFDELCAAIKRIGLPAVLKTRRMGYDGKGQHILRLPGDEVRAWAELGNAPLLLEQFISFEREVSIIAARGRSGETIFYPLVENHHSSGILRLSLAPAPNLTPELQAKAECYSRRVLEVLNYVGVLAIEFFQYEGELLANEMAPRVHNSGHWTIEGAETSQFENHLRAGLGLPLGATTSIGCSAMVNLIGEAPELAKVLALAGTHLHLYDKTPLAGRKLGHITVRAASWEELEAHLAQLRRLIP